jgi:hypothetical protein
MSKLLMDDLNDYSRRRGSLRLAEKTGVAALSLHARGGPA